MQEFKSGISGVVITFNEEEKISRCIDSMKGVVDEVVVIDSISTDNTVQICREKGARVISQPFLGYVEQKNYAMQQASYSYVLSIDADEALSEGMIKALTSIKKELRHDAYRFNRLNNFYGRWLRHGQWYPDRKIRLWRKAKGHWGGHNPHDKVIMDAGTSVVDVKVDILHFAYNTVEDHVKQVSHFARVYAKAAAKKGRKAGVVKDIIISPVFKFIKRYIFYRGFLDGYHGFIACYNAAILNYYKYLYLREINKGRMSGE